MSSMIPSDNNTTRIGVIALSRILDGPRIRRQCEILCAYGYEVFAIGQDDVRQEAVPWTIVRKAQSNLEMLQSKRPGFSPIGSSMQRSRMSSIVLESGISLQVAH